MQVRLTLGAADFHSGPQIDENGDGRVAREELDRQIEPLVDQVIAHFHIGDPNPPYRSLLTQYSLTAPNVVQLDVVYDFDSDVGVLSVASTLDQITQEDHRHLLQIGEGDDIRTAVLDRDYPTIEINHAAGIPLWVNLLDFVGLGIEHIFTGYDHLAFLIALVLATTTLVSLAKIVTCFTIAHSVTLALATLDIVVLPSRLIESVIALSIAYVAIENFVGRNLVHRSVVTFVFGLVHGFGFSNVLRQMGLAPSRLAISLFSFNLGVEVGQLACVALLFPLLIYLGRTKWKDTFMSAASVAIMSLGFYWFVLRAFFA